MSDKLFDAIPWIVGVIIALVVALIGAAIYLEIQQATGIQSGYIWRKQYAPASSYTVPQTVGTGTSATTIQVPQRTEERFTLFIGDGDEENWVYVPKDVWDSADVGEYFDGDCYCVRAQ